MQTPKIWIDADNPPQAQYLAPMAGIFRSRGCDVLLTARDHAGTLAILEDRGETPVVRGKMFGPSKGEKILGNLGRISYLSREVFAHFGSRPDALVVGQARGAILTAGLMRVPTFVLLDYEGVEMASMKWSGAQILHPEVVPPTRFTARGFPGRRLIGFPGIKEDITFTGLPQAAAGQEKLTLPSPHDPNLISILIRPPSQTSHYRSESTVRLLGDLLDQLALRDDVQVVFSPREAAQEKLLEGRRWLVEPVILKEPLPLAGLLATVDWVVTGGGTMVREAAWMGVPGVSIFTGDAPAVDEWLERAGAIIRVSDAESAGRIRWEEPGAMAMIERRPDAIEAVADHVLANARRGKGQ